MEFKIKDKVKALLINPFTISLVIAGLLVLIGIFASVRWLDSYTEHGVEVSVPELSGKSVTEAELLLKERGLYVEVVDSVYKAGFKPGAVVEQVPQAGSKVKDGRKIYIYVRAKGSRQVAVPDFSGNTSRQVEEALKSAGLVVKDFEFVSSEHRGIVVGLTANGKNVAAGTKLAEGTSVIIKVGRGTNSEFLPMRSLRRMDEESAKSLLRQDCFSIANAIYDIKPANEADKAKYKIYRQIPITGTKMVGDEKIVIYLTTDESKFDTPEEVVESENK